MLQFHPGPSRNHHLSGKQQVESQSRLPGCVFRQIEIVAYSFRDGLSLSPSNSLIATQC